MTINVVRRSSMADWMKLAGMVACPIKVKSKINAAEPVCIAQGVSMMKRRHLSSGTYDMRTKPKSPMDKLAFDDDFEDLGDGSRRIVANGQR